MQGHCIMGSPRHEEASKKSSFELAMTLTSPTSHVVFKRDPRMATSDVVH